MAVKQKQMGRPFSRSRVTAAPSWPCWEGPSTLPSRFFIFLTSRHMRPKDFCLRRFSRSSRRIPGKRFPPAAFERRRSARPGCLPVPGPPAPRIRARRRAGSRGNGTGRPRPRSPGSRPPGCPDPPRVAVPQTRGVDDESAVGNQDHFPAGGGCRVGPGSRTSGLRPSAGFPRRPGRLIRVDLPLPRNDEHHGPARTAMFSQPAQAFARRGADHQHGNVRGDSFTSASLP